jgi:hypothetical protein
MGCVITLNFNPIKYNYKNNLAKEEQRTAQPVIASTLQLEGNHLRTPETYPLLSLTDPRENVLICSVTVRIGPKRLFQRECVRYVNIPNVKHYSLLHVPIFVLSFLDCSNAVKPQTDIIRSLLKF